MILELTVSKVESYKYKDKILSILTDIVDDIEYIQSHFQISTGE